MELQKHEFWVLKGHNTKKLSQYELDVFELNSFFATQEFSQFLKPR